MSRKLIVTEYLTLDGVFEEPRWSFQFWSDEAAQFKYDELFAADAMLLGRKTYEGFAAAWPSFTDEKGFADRMNGMPKRVVSSTLTEPSWNNSHVIPAGAIRDLPDETLLVAGSATLVQALFEQGL